MTTHSVYDYPVEHRPRFLNHGLPATGELTVDDVLGVQAINDDSEVRWIYSFLTGDRRKSYCLYEAPSADHIREAARRASLPADVIISVDQFDPVAFLGSASS